jgi:transcription termination factor Rho
MELTLDRKLSERRVFPAIDVTRSSTRREELLLDEKTLRAVVALRRMFAALAEQDKDNVETLDRLMGQIRKTTSNDEFVETLAKSMA